MIRSFGQPGKARSTNMRTTGMHFQQPRSKSGFSHQAHMDFNRY